MAGMVIWPDLPLSLARCRAGRSIEGSGMPDTPKDGETIFNETLKRMLDAKPKPRAKPERPPSTAAAKPDSKSD